MTDIYGNKIVQLFTFNISHRNNIWTQFNGACMPYWYTCQLLNCKWCNMHASITCDVCFNIWELWSRYPSESTSICQLQIQKCRLHPQYRFPQMMQTQPPKAAPQGRTWNWCDLICIVKFEGYKKSAYRSHIKTNKSHRSFHLSVGLIIHGYLQKPSQNAT